MPVISHHAPPGNSRYRETKRVGSDKLASSWRFAQLRKESGSPLRNPGAVKRQKELARQQKRQDKLAERARRSAEKKLRPAGLGAPTEDAAAESGDHPDETPEGTTSE